MKYYFTGIDGSGKTSILDAIEKQLQQDDLETMRIWARYTPRLSKIFVDIFKKKAIDKTGNYNDLSEDDYSAWKLKKRKITRYKLVRLTLFTFFFIDYSFQIKKVFRKMRKNNEKIILLDRFIIDFLVDQTVNFGDLSDTWIFRRLIKACDIFNTVFLISVRPEIALKRKNDIPGYTYLNERDRIYKEIFSQLKTGHIIDNSGDPDIAVSEILTIIRK